MKICAIICEFNPFHNGHRYIIEQAKKLSGCDAALCIMSGDFTQRGEACIFDKYQRAEHAVRGGADCVIQLPAAFAVAPAEIFAKGALKILSAIPEVCALAFGAENGSAEEFIDSAKLTFDESEKFKSVLNAALASGESYIKSYTAAFKACGGKESLVREPNNVLALEYTKAILRTGKDIKIFPVKRIGAAYNDGALKDNFSSASAIRNEPNGEKVKDNVPDFVYPDLKNAVDCSAFDNYFRHCLFTSDAETLKSVYGGGEGLENKLKSLENLPLESIVEKATSKRYPSSRIRRMLCANALGLFRADCERFLNANLYIKPLAVKKTCADEMLAALSKSEFPVITGPYGEKLAHGARDCFEKDIFEFRLYNHISGRNKKDYMVLI